MERRAGNNLETMRHRRKEVSSDVGGESAEIRGTQHILSEAQGEP